MRKERIVNSLQRFKNLPWVKHFACIQYEDDGSVKGCIFLQTSPTNVQSDVVRFLHNQNNSWLGTSVLPQGDGLPEMVESAHLGNSIDKFHTKTSKDYLLDCLLEAFYLALPSYAPEGQYGQGTETKTTDREAV